ncbi:hypothetical protein BDP27DRAFT_802312 [Rhodocollybia butyracea]|uniref:DNA replication checkpoint mediator MRC1 domain-containing protein n=1 Tax=Rhodocollybia butyracea TaxID=206335 RepID=A0A9P5Q7D8_9AGAR|nr:hypothetical protein BDP27DRAFT_802312 [Rhodocollybia butyracea]
MSSSPSSASNVKRPARTYGRPRPVTEDPAPNSSHRISDSVSSDVSFSNITSDAPGSAPPTSEPANSSPAQADDDEANSDDERRNNASSKFNWDWKKKLKKMDDSEDEEEAGKEVASMVELIDQGPKLAPLSAEQSMSDTESLSTLTVSPYPLRQSGVRKRVKRAVDPDAESDQEQSKSSYPSSPIKHPINSPKARSSTTPPTSGDENDMPKAKPSSKGKLVMAPTPLVFEPTVDPKAGKKGKRSQTNKVKRPTKKEIRETILDRQRINAEKQVSIPRAPQTNKLTLTNLLATIASRSTSKLTAVPLKGEDSMDPISDWSSPSGNHGLAPAPLTRHDIPIQLPAAADSESDDAFPDPNEILGPMPRTNNNSLREMKLQMLQQQQYHHSDDEDDDLEVVDAPSTSVQVAIKQEAQARKSGRPSISLNARVVQKHAGISASHRPTHVATASQARNNRQLNDALIKRIKSDNARRTQEKSEEWVRRGGKPLEREAGGEAEIRGPEWYAQRGLEKKEVQEQDQAEERFEDEDDDEWTPGLRGSASPAPQEGGSDNEDAENEDSDDDDGDQDVTMVNENEDVTEGEEETPTQVDIIHHKRSKKGVVHSDTEDEENNENDPPPLQPRPFGKILVEDSMILDDREPLPPLQRQSDSSSYDGATEDEGDKENNDRLMYDRSEDKENTAVVRHGLSSLGIIASSSGRPLLGRQQSPRFSPSESRRRSLSMSPNGGGGYTTDEDKENENSNPNPTSSFRGPLKTLSVAEMESPFTPSVPAVPFVARLQRASSAATIADTDEVSSQRTLLSPALGPLLPRERQVSAFSQFSDNGLAEVSQPKKLEAGFSDFFNSNDANNPKSSTAKTATAFEMFKAPTQTNNFFAKLRENTSLGLTQDVGLRPALEVDENLKRQADRVFEKEQEFLLDAANQSMEQKQPDLYINELGFLTQTRPDDNAEVYQPPPTPSQPFSPNEKIALSQTSARRPFRELSTSRIDLDDTPVSSLARVPLQRLRKRGGSQSPSGSRSAFHNVNFGFDEGGRTGQIAASTPSPSLSPINGLRVKAAGENPRLPKFPKLPKPRRRLEKSAFVEAEAQESDEDEMFGFRKPDEGDEEDGEDQDRTLETLVDDKELDQVEIAEERVMEKYKEQVQADDARDEELAYRAIEGGMRYGRNKRDRLELEGSDDDMEEDERSRRIRRKMKEPELRGDIKSLSENDATKAFAQQYETGVVDDGNPELEYLQREDSQDVTMADTTYRSESNEYADTDEEEGEGNVVSVAEVRRQVQELVKNGEDDNGPVLDPNDTSFVDAGFEDDDAYLPTVRLLSNAPRRTRRAADSFDMDVTENHKSESMVDEHGRHRAETFVKTEHRVRRMGTRSNVGGISVMPGHKTITAKPGTSSSRDSMAARKPVPIKAASSMLSRVDRKDRFQ